MILWTSVALLGGAGCGEASPVAGAGAPTPPQGRGESGTFQATAVTEDGKPRELVAGSEIRLVFRDAGISASAGCNDMTGRASVVAGERLVVSDLTTTDKFCGDDLARQEAWLAEFLEGQPTWSRTGDELVLRGGTAEIRLTA